MKWLFLFIGCFAFQPTCVSWGFTAHKTINYSSVFILPKEMFGFYKKHIAFLEANAVKPDMRRYIDPEEGARHYLDVDFFEDALPLDSIPHRWDSAMAMYGNDTLQEHGIVPWHIMKMKYWLTLAFAEHDYAGILRLSADLGHYIGDLHVPLHTTENYNGQLSNQEGIHGLWESRLVELNLNHIDLFIGSATYIPNLNDSLWKALEESYRLTDSVFQIEKKITEDHKDAWKYTFENRKSQLVKTYSKPFCRLYYNQLNKMVQRRLRASIEMTASVWMTAWVDAGQPDLDEDVEWLPIVDTSQQFVDSMSILGRPEPLD